MFWFILFGLITVFGIYSLTYYIIKDNRYSCDEGWVVIGVICIILGCIALVCVGTIIADYNTFEVSFETQREILNMIDINTSDVTFIADIITDNKILANYKARNELFGFFSLIPDRVQNITPLGIEMP